MEEKPAIVPGGLLPPSTAPPSGSKDENSDKAAISDVATGCLSLSTAGDHGPRQSFPKSSSERGGPTRWYRVVDSRACHQQLSAFDSANCR